MLLSQGGWSCFWVFLSPPCSRLIFPPSIPLFASFPFEFFRLLSVGCLFYYLTWKFLVQSHDSFSCSPLASGLPGSTSIFPSFHSTVDFLTFLSSFPSITVDSLVLILSFRMTALFCGLLVSLSPCYIDGFWTSLVLFLTSDYDLLKFCFQRLIFYFLIEVGKPKFLNYSFLPCRNQQNFSCWLVTQQRIVFPSVPY